MPNSTHSITTLLFDWDGTLADSAHLGLAAFQKTFAELGVPFSQEIYEAAYSPNWYLVYEALGLPSEKWPSADSLWQRHYGQETAQLIAGAADTVLDLERRGYRLGVVTSGNENRVRLEIEQASLDRIFQVLICHEHVVNRKPHSEGLEIAMRRLQSRREQVAYVGDTPEDIQMGKQADVFTVGIHGNYPSSARLSESGPDLYLETITGLLDHFQRAGNQSARVGSDALIK